MTSSHAPVRFGFLATGKIAAKVARDLALVEEASLAAVASRDLDRARAFAGGHETEHDLARGSVRAHGSYESLLADPDVDVVYVATPHSSHLELTRAAFEAGKHVLCEKPVTLDRATAAEMVDLARTHDRFLMEAMWMATHPVVRKVAAELRAGRFGTPHHLFAELGFRVDDPPSSRMFDPALGASAVLDMGIYPLTFAHLMLGEAERLSGLATLSDRGIDLDIAVTGRYPGGVLALLAASMTSWSTEAATIATEEGLLRFPRGFHHPDHATFEPHGPDGDPVRIEADVPLPGVGYTHEIVEVARCVRAGLRESPLVPHAQTLTIMGQLDDLRAQTGVVLPS